MITEVKSETKNYYKLIICKLKKQPEIILAEVGLLLTDRRPVIF